MSITDVKLNILFVVVMLFRAGSLLVQIGTFPTENVYNIIFQNVVTFSISVISFALFGYTLAYGRQDFCGFFSFGSWIDSVDVNYERAIYGICAALIGSSVITMQVSGRLHFVAYILIEIFYSGLMLPLVMHWTWHEDGWLRNLNFFDVNVTFVDYAGGVLIHTTSGIVGLLGSLFLGRRLLRLNRLDDCSVGTESSGATLVGYILMALGLLGMSLPKIVHLKHALSVVLINMIVAMAVCTAVAITIQLIFCNKQFNYWAILSCVQASLAGLIITSSGIMYYSTVISILIALIGAALYTLASRCVQVSAIEDYSNVIALHLICGLASTIFPQIFKHETNRKILYGTSWNILAALMISALFFVTFSLVFAVLWCCGFLRNINDEVCHERTKRLLDNKNVSFARRLLGFKDEVFLEPGFANRKIGSMETRSTNSLTGRTRGGFKKFSDYSFKHNGTSQDRSKIFGDRNKDYRNSQSFENQSDDKFINYKEEFFIGADDYKMSNFDSD
ncbi:PREDICTED: ammonium transporter 3-like [Nicrophorus vespilloides]|uniref:Ammonium transporter 3-like n=1 Tax=Nicrophorus vespilloides TaxID=110193 RepID=A0ABM1MF16_NICVS|nr:PREDICTED: ammonium transporter 3-like [Nicrophorus vespilloides]